MGRRLKIEDLKDMGDGSFEKMQEQARECAGGDSEKGIELLTQMVVHDFLSSGRNKIATAHISETESAGVHVGTNPTILNIMWKVRKARKFKTSEINKENKDWTWTVTRIFPISQTKEKLFKEKVFVEKDRPKLSTKKRVCSWSDDKEKRRTAKKPKTTKKETIEVPSELPDQFKNKIQEMNGTEPKLLIQKQVQETDLNRHQRRFSIPRGELKATEFLTREEHTIVDRNESIEVTLLDPVLQEFKVNFKRWKMGNSFTYNLTSGWIKFLEKNKVDEILKVDDWIQIWYFQKDSKTCLALVNLSHGAQGQVVSSSGGIGCDGEVTSSGGASLSTQENININRDIDI